MKDSFYFSHDCNARNDIKIIKLRRQLGLEGYGLYWCLIEMLRDTAEYKLPLSIVDDIAFDINTSREKVEAVIHNYDLFNIEDNLFFSTRLIRTMDIYKTQKTILSEGGKKGMHNRWSKQKAEEKKNPNSWI